VASSINQRIYRKAVSHQFAVQHFAAGLVADIIGLLNAADEDLERTLRRLLQDNKEGRASLARSQELREEIRSLNAGAMRSLGRSLPGRLSRYAAVEERIQREQIIEKPVQDVTGYRFRLRKVDPEVLAGIVSSKPWEGRLLSEHLQNISARRRARINQTINVGMALGKSTDSIVLDVMGRSTGKKTKNGRLIRKGGALNASRKEVQALVHTYVAHVSSEVRSNLFQANKDVVKKVMWISTLDENTTPICRPRDHKIYTLDHEPVGHDLPWLSGPGQAHWRCRSTLIAVLSAADLPINWSKVKESRRAALSRDEAGRILVGDVPASTDYEQWFRDQPLRTQRQVLGRARADWYRANSRATVGEAWAQKLKGGRVLDLAGLESSAASLTA
jgi:SPP1 gp7 family putative phage head morphogenesis protein